MRSPSVRRLKPGEFAGHIPSIATLERSCFKIEHWDEDKLLGKRHHFWWAAFDGDEIIGAVMAKHDEGYLFVERIAVSPRARRSGVGTKMLQAVQRAADSLGSGSIKTYIHWRNFASLNLFVKLGFKFYAGTVYASVKRDEDHWLWLRKNVL